MTGRATFGDCARVATEHLSEPALRPSDLIRPNPASIAGVIQDYNYGLHRVIKAMTRYLSGIVAAMQTTPGPHDPAAASWLRASAEAKNAAQAAMHYSPLLSPDGRIRLQLGAATSHVIQHLDSAASAMAAGRDLLFTHFATSPDGSLQPRSGWVPVIESAPVNQALLIMVARWARQIVTEGTYLSSSPALRGKAGAADRTRLLGICDRLSGLVSAVDAAQHQYPAPDDAAAQLQAIPGNFLQPQRIPTRTETVSGLCRGLTESAERVRHAFTTAIPDAAWSPEASAESFSRSAVYATAISYHCQMLQHALATRAADLGDRQLSQQLTASASASARASKAWLRAAHRWYHVKTDAISEASPASAEAADLMTWTGRLAHADPDWTPTFGPSHDARAPHDLAPDASDISPVIPAIHEASTTLTSIAAADYERIRTAAQSGRLLVPAIHSAEDRHAGRLFAKAPKNLAESLLGAYGQAGTTSVKAATKTADIIAAVARRSVGHAIVTVQVEGRMPGPVERRLAELGVTSPTLLERGAAIDQSARQLISEAAQETAPQRWHVAVAGQTAVADTGKLARQLLAPERPRRPGPRNSPRAARPERELEAGR